MLFCLIALPWYVAVQLRNPDFFHAFILQHNLERFSSNLYHHRQPFWYYIPVVLLALLPWTSSQSPPWLRPSRDGGQDRRELLKSEGGKEDALNLFLLIWLLVPVVFLLHLPIEIARLYSSGAAPRHFAAGRLCAPPVADDHPPAAGFRRPARGGRRRPRYSLRCCWGQILLLHHITWSTRTLIALASPPCWLIGIALTLRLPTGFACCVLSL